MSSTCLNLRTSTLERVCSGWSRVVVSFVLQIDVHMWVIHVQKDLVYGQRRACWVVDAKIRSTDDVGKSTYRCCCGPETRCGDERLLNPRLVIRVINLQET